MEWMLSTWLYIWGFLRDCKLWTFSLSSRTNTNDLPIQIMFWKMPTSISWSRGPLSASRCCSNVTTLYFIPHVFYSVFEINNKARFASETFMKPKCWSAKLKTTSTWMDLLYIRSWAPCRYFQRKTQKKLLYKMEMNLVCVDIL